MESLPVEDHEDQSIAIGIPLDVSEANEEKISQPVIQAPEGLTIEKAQEYAMPGLSE